MDKPILNKPILNYNLHAYIYTFKIAMYVNSTFSPSISGHNVCFLELPDQDNEKVVDRVCRDEWQLAIGKGN